MTKRPAILSLLRAAVRSGLPIALAASAGACTSDEPPGAGADAAGGPGSDAASDGGPPGAADGTADGKIDVASDAATPPESDAAPGDAPAGDALADAGEAADGTPDSTGCPGCDVAPPSCEPGSVLLVGTAAQPTAALALAQRPGGALVAWLDGAAVHARALGPDGAPAGDALVLEGAGAPVANIEVTAAPEGFAVFWSRGLLDDAAAPEDVTVLQARVGLDGAVAMAPAPVLSGIQLGRGSGAGDAGFRLWGLEDVLDPDDGQVYRQATMARLSPEGGIDGVHYMLSAQKFSKMRLHHSGNQLNTPFVGPTSEGEIAYFLASIYLPGCGLPVQPVFAIGPGGTMATSGFISPQDALWALRDGEGGTGRLVFYDMAGLAATERPLPFPPTDRADMATDEALGQALLVDVQGDALVGCTATPALLGVGAAEPLAELSAGADALAVRVAAAQGEWRVAWAESTGAVRARAVCTAP